MTYILIILYILSIVVSYLLMRSGIKLTGSRFTKSDRLKCLFLSIWPIVGFLAALITYCVIVIETNGGDQEASW